MRCRPTAAAAAPKEGLLHLLRRRRLVQLLLLAVTTYFGYVVLSRHVASVRPNSVSKASKRSGYWRGVLEVGDSLVQIQVADQFRQPFAFSFV